MLDSAKRLLMRVLRSEVTLASFILLAILNIAFFPALWGNRTLMTSANVYSLYANGAQTSPSPGTTDRSPDVGASAWQFEPAMAFNGDQIFRHFRLPRWNPYAAYGAPWAAGMMQQPIFPLALIPEAFPGPHAIAWFLILRLFLAGIFTFLFLRFFICFTGGLVAGIAFMLTGYFVMYLNIDHLSTEILLPAVFWSFERMHRIASSRGAIPAAIIIFLSIVSGMPESTLLILSFGYLYYVFRVFTDRADSVARELGRLVAANLIGFGLAAFLLFPFVEFMQNGLDGLRQSRTSFGLIALSTPRGFLFYLIPLIFGTLRSAAFAKFSIGSDTWMSGYFGIGPIVLAGIALISLLRGRKTGTAAERNLILFFAFTASLFMLKRWGSPFVNWIGTLPLFNLIIYPKYIQPLLGFAVACLAGFGAAKVRSGAFVRESWVVLTSVLGITLLLFRSYRVQAYLGDEGGIHLIYMTLIAGFVLLFAWTIALVNAGSARWGRMFSNAVILLVAAELTLNYIFPVFYLFGQLPVSDRNPYVGAPYVRFLQSRRSDYYRVFARDAVLFPNWASAFGLYDVRYLYGLTYNRYLQFARAFLLEPEFANEINGELADRFTGVSKPYRFLDPLELRYLQLSSIRYLATSTPYVGHLSPLITQVLLENAERVSKEALGVQRRIFTLDGQARDVLFEHPPASRVALTTTVPAETSYFTFSPVIDPKVPPGGGDGVTFRIELDDLSGGKTRLLYDRYINPKAAPKAQHWTEQKLDLTAYAGKRVRLLLTTTGGPMNNTAYDWAAWGFLEFTGAHASETHRPDPNPFQLAFGGDVEVYEYKGSLPRASLFSSAIAVSSSKAALAALREPGFDPWRQVVLEADTAATREAAAPFETQALATARPAKIEFYDAERVVVRADVDTPSVLLLTDSNYPGWKAYVDGLPATMLKANFLFRGVTLAPGKHRVEFHYAPSSYAVGYAFSLCAAAAAAAWAYYDRVRRRKESMAEPARAAS